MGVNLSYFDRKWSRNVVISPDCPNIASSSPDLLAYHFCSSAISSNHNEVPSLR
jgi:hypothetical protein